MSVHVEHVTCEQFVELLTDYLEHAVDPQLRADIERHIVICRGCANYAEQMRSTIELLAEVAAGESGNGQSDELVALFRRWRDEQGQAG
jgi:anti-sigma factor RsiW